MALRALLGSGHDSVAGIRGGHAYICAMLLALDMLLASHDRQPGRARHLYRAARTRITLHDQSACTPADQGECDSGEPCRTEPDASRPAETREVGGSIPSLPTTSAQVNGAGSPGFP
jgi:hypothetical protein